MGTDWMNWLWVHLYSHLPLNPVIRDSSHFKVRHRILLFNFYYEMLYSLDSRNTKKLKKTKTEMLSFYKQQPYFSPIVSKKSRNDNVIFFMKYPKNNNITLRSLWNEVARLTLLNKVKRASSFNRDLRVFWV